MDCALLKSTVQDSLFHDLKFYFKNKILNFNKLTFYLSSFLIFFKNNVYLFYVTTKEIITYLFKSSTGKIQKKQKNHFFAFFYYFFSEKEIIHLLVKKV